MGGMSGSGFFLLAMVFHVYVCMCIYVLIHTRVCVCVCVDTHMLNHTLLGPLIGIGRYEYIM